MHQKTRSVHKPFSNHSVSFSLSLTNPTVIGPSTTQLFRNLSCTLNFPGGSEIILSKLDHETNVASWLDLAQRCNLLAKWWVPDQSIKQSFGNTNPKLTPENLLPLLSDKTVFVACTHASNILGTIHDVKALANTIRTRCPEALFCVDAVAYAPHRQIQVIDLDVDFYAFSWYKVYGPHIAQLYASPRGLKAMRSLGHYFNGSSSLQDKLGLAGSSYELVAAIPAVTDYFCRVSGSQDLFWAQVKEHEEQLQKLLLDYLTSNSKVVILGEQNHNADVRVATISFIVQGRGSREIVEAVDQAAGYKQAILSNGKDGDMGLGESRQFGIRWGHFYSKRLCEEVLGLEKDGEGVIRVSMVHYNTVEEVQSLIEAIRQVLG